MDDFNISSLHESRNEWTSRLVTILTPLVIEGLKSIFDESLKLCKDNDEDEKYLLTFQNFISRIPHWNPAIIEVEQKRIVDRSGCNYLQDLVTCTHIIQLKLLTAIRAGHKQKKIDIKVPPLDIFIHKMYIHVARKIYKNVYLFEMDIAPLQIQKNNRELEVIIQECILNAIRESIPVESILRAYMDGTMEEHVTEEIEEKVIEDPKAKVEKEIEAEIKKEIEKSIADEEIKVTAPTLETETSGGGGGFSGGSHLTFNDIDRVQSTDGVVSDIVAPKDVDSLNARAAVSTFNQDMDDEDDDDPVGGGGGGGGRLTIHGDVSLDSMDIHRIDEPELNLLPDLLIDAEVLM